MPTYALVGMTHDEPSGLDRESARRPANDDACGLFDRLDRFGEVRLRTEFIDPRPLP